MYDYIVKMQQKCFISHKYFLPLPWNHMIPVDWGVPGRERVVILATLSYYLGTPSFRIVCHSSDIYYL